MTQPDGTVSKGSRFALLIVTLTLPSLGVMAARFGLPFPGPASAEAGEMNGEALVLPGLTKPLTMEQSAIGAAFIEEAAKPFGPTPILSRAAESPREIFTAASPNTDPAPEPLRAGDSPVFALSSVMGNAQVPMAVINGKLRRTGDTVLAGWKVAAIDLEAGTVRMTSDLGAGMTIAMPARGIEPR